MSIFSKFRISSLRANTALQSGESSHTGLTSYQSFEQRKQIETQRQHIQEYRAAGVHYVPDAIRANTVSGSGVDVSMQTHGSMRHASASRRNRVAAPSHPGIQTSQSTAARVRFSGSSSVKRFDPYSS